MNPSDNVLRPAYDWFERQGWNPFPYQEATWKAFLAGRSGLVNAPTGTGKTYSLLLPILLEHMRDHGTGSTPCGIKAIWISPIRALAREIHLSAVRAIEGFGLDWEVGIRTGDTSSAQRARQKRKPPQILITTPESLHLILATKGFSNWLNGLRSVIIDEWHELMGSKRGVQTELAMSRLKTVVPGLKVWGVSATIGNMEEAAEVLTGGGAGGRDFQFIRANVPKPLEIVSLLPNEIEHFPWAGHLGIRMLEKVVPIIRGSRSTLIFTNTRSFCEIWYQQLLEVAPDLAGQIAMHHGSISREIRDWVEKALHEGRLKAVVCTSSLDLGVDFRPVESVVQVGSPKGVARFLQRAGRSGHQPGALSRIFFVPTHALELIEAAGLRKAFREGRIEARRPHIRSWDVLVQYLITLAVSEGFDPDQIFREVRGTFSFKSMSRDEWFWLLDFITTGGESLQAYAEYRKVVFEAGRYKVKDKQVAIRHRLSIGTIVGDNALRIEYVSGKKIGSIEEWFIAQLKPGDVFWFGGRSLELVRIRGMTVQVRKSSSKKGKVPSWLGGRLPLSSELSELLRLEVDHFARGQLEEPELEALRPLLEFQAERSHLPKKDELLIEYFKSQEGYHLLCYPFEGRFVHEGMGALIAWRISRLKPISFSIAMNDYGFELLSDTEIPIDAALKQGLFGTKDLLQDIQASLNAVEMARRRFRDIASIAGLVFKGYPGREKKDRHLQSSSGLFFEVFSDYEPENLLLQQAYEEVLTFQLEETRLREALHRAGRQQVVLIQPEKATPFAFPIMVDRLRERISSEKLEDRIRRMQVRLEK